MRRWKTNVIAILLVGLLVSCSHDEDYYSLGKFWLTLGIVETENTMGYDYLVITDAKDTLIPTVQNFYNFNFEDGQRILINYTILDEYNNLEKTFYTKINSVQEVLLKDIIERTDANSDSLGDDRVNITDIWQSDNFLNIEFEYFGHGYVQHYINLAKDDTVSSEPFDLHFLHNANDDSNGVLLNGIVSFHLNELQVEGKDSVQYNVTYSNFEGESLTLNGTYRY